MRKETETHPTRAERRWHGPREPQSSVVESFVFEQHARIQEAWKNEFERLRGEQLTFDSYQRVAKNIGYCSQTVVKQCLEWANNATGALSEASMTVAVHHFLPTIIKATNRAYRNRPNADTDTGIDKLAGLNEGLGVIMDAIYQGTANSTVINKRTHYLVQNQALSRETPSGLAPDMERAIDPSLQEVQSTGETAVFAREREDAVQQVIDQLPKRMAEIIRLRFGLYKGYPYTLEQAGKRLGISRERARQIEAFALRRMREISARGKTLDMFTDLRYDYLIKVRIQRMVQAAAEETDSKSALERLEFAEELLIETYSKEAVDAYRARRDNPYYKPGVSFVLDTLRGIRDIKAQKISEKSTGETAQTP